MLSPFFKWLPNPDFCISILTFFSGSTGLVQAYVLSFPVLSLPPVSLTSVLSSLMI
jgi:hypothetical protein